ncbi:MAG TPA: calcium/sodium antiporter [Bacteroidales bacterium]|nr:calcium/sodium antiporter [Bacteroidales bacterium]
MENIVINIVLLMLGLGLLAKGAGWLVEGSASIARKYGISELVIGLTVVGFGTSMPEFIVNVIASINAEAGDIVIGNIIGSNNFNLLFIIGVSGLIAPLVVQGTTVWKEIPFSLLAIVVLMILANDRFLFHAESDVLGRIDGIVLLAFFCGFIYYIFRAVRSDQHLQFESGKVHGSGRVAVIIVLGLAALIIGGKLMVDGAVSIAEAMNVSNKLIGLTIVSAGTSMPELATSIVAARKGKADLAVGNIIGSNIFNILFILGISVLVRPVSYAIDFNIDGWVLIVGTVFLFVAMFMGKKRKVDRWEAVLFLIAYLAYIYYLICKS